MTWVRKVGNLGSCLLSFATVLALRERWALSSSLPGRSSVTIECVLPSVQIDRTPEEAAKSSLIFEFVYLDRFSDNGQ